MTRRIRQSVWKRWVSRCCYVSEPPSHWTFLRFGARAGLGWPPEADKKPIQFALTACHVSGCEAARNSMDSSHDWYTARSFSCMGGTSQRSSSHWVRVDGLVADFRAASWVVSMLKLLALYIPRSDLTARISFKGKINVFAASNRAGSGNDNGTKLMTYRIGEKM